MNDLITTQEVAKLINRHSTCVDKWVKNAWLPRPATKEAGTGRGRGRNLFSRAEVERFIEKLPSHVNINDSPRTRKIRARAAIIEVEENRRTIDRAHEQEDAVFATAASAARIELYANQCAYFLKMLCEELNINLKVKL